MRAYLRRIAFGTPGFHFPSVCLARWDAACLIAVIIVAAAYAVSAAVSVQVSAPYVATGIIKVRTSFIFSQRRTFLAVHTLRRRLVARAVAARRAMSSGLMLPLSLIMDPRYRKFATFLISLSCIVMLACAIVVTVGVGRLFWSGGGRGIGG